HRREIPTTATTTAGSQHADLGGDQGATVHARLVEDAGEAVDARVVTEGEGRGVGGEGTAVGRGADELAVDVERGGGAVEGHGHVGPGVERRLAVGAEGGVAPGDAVGVGDGAGGPAEEAVVTVLVQEGAALGGGGIDPGGEGEAGAGDVEAGR